MTDTAVLARPTTRARSISLTPETAWWILRIGAALCFIGHGAFGFITKAAWVPYFGVVGIPARWAWDLMPIIGAVDVTVGMAVLFAPRALPLVYMAVWALWTACLRPLAGESGFEALERAGNYGVPAALLWWSGAPRTWRSSLALIHSPRLPIDRARLILILRITTALLLVGHGALGAIVGKPLLGQHYAAVGLPPGTMPLLGWLEIGLGLAVAIRPLAGVVAFIAVWKLATESLFLFAGAPIWELVERAGSVAAPLALWILLRARWDRAPKPTADR